jgi:hypothetical protein
MVAVLHVNKSKESHDMRGHAGTMLLQKAADVFEVTKSKGGQLYTVTQTDTRNRPLCDMVNNAVITFSLDGDGVPMPATDISEAAEADKRLKLKNEFVKAFGDNTAMSYTQLSRAYTFMNGYKPSQKNDKEVYPTGNKKIKIAVDYGLLTSDVNGNYSLAIN